MFGLFKNNDRIIKTMAEEKSFNKKNNFSGQAYLVSVNMGYGHQRAIYPLKHLSYEGQIINANDYQGIPDKDRKVWQNTRKAYEAISRFKKVPLIGKLAFSLFDYFQKIRQFYPKRDLSKANFQLKQTYSLIKKGWGSDLIKKLNIENKKLQSNLPIISSFFVTAFMAEYFDYSGEIFCLVCDTDISRSWAPLKAKESRIKYLASTERTAERLKLYGVKEENIFLSGFPLPLENIGSPEMEIVKDDFRHRLINLDPQKRFVEYYYPLVAYHLKNLPEQADHILTLMFAIGGAGSQKEIGAKIIKKMAKKIKNKEIKIIISAGTRKEVKDYFERCSRGLSIEIIFADDFAEYFKKFNQALRKTDILWSKPSELSFYSALALPIIIAPPVGSQEKFNKRWLLKSGFGLAQERIDCLEEWLFDWIKKGYLAEAAMQGFIEGNKSATFNIETICSGS